MKPLDVIARTRDGGELTARDIAAFVAGYTRGEIPDYQVSAWLMAVVLRGLTQRETVALTQAIVDSGRTLRWPASLGVVTDKHSTGGVGDKTSLVVAPLVAAMGVPVAKMSGRGLGHTGGTLDKLESLPGLSVNLTVEEFQAQVARIGLAIVAQSPDLAPADGKLYTLRDVTGTVESLPLIASSVMSKKIAAGAEAIVLDVKAGGGAFMRTADEARSLSATMVALGEAVGRKVRAVISAMDAPLGRAVGNALEVKEALTALRGEGPADLTDLALALSAELVTLARPTQPRARTVAELQDHLRSGAALEKFRAMAEAQGGEGRALDDPRLLPSAPVVVEGPSLRAGYVQLVDARIVGEAVVALGGGRTVKGAAIDPRVGFVLRAKPGDRVVKGESLFEVHAAARPDADEAVARAMAAYRIADDPPPPRPLLIEVI